MAVVSASRECSAIWRSSTESLWPSQTRAIFGLLPPAVLYPFYSQITNGLFFGSISVITCARDCAVQRQKVKSPFSARATMGCCFSGPQEVGVADADKPGAFKVKVRLSTGMEIPVHVLPSDTIAGIKRKIEAVYGRQPHVAVKGQLQPPEILIMHEENWYMADPNITVAQAKVNASSKIKFQDIYDKIDKIKKLSHAHWFVSNAAAIAVSQ